MIWLVHDRWILLEQAVGLPAPWHTRLGKLRYPHRTLWGPRDDVKQIHSVTTKFNQDNNPEYITGIDAATSKEVRLDSSYGTNTSQVIMLFDGVEEGRATEELIPASRTIKFNLVHPSDPSLNVELTVSSPTEEVHLGDTEITAEIKIGADTYSNPALLGARQDPQTLIDYNDHLIQHPELGRAQVAALHEAMVGPLVVYVWEGIQPTEVILTTWQWVLCAFGTGLSDTFGNLITGIYGGLNVYLCLQAPQ